MNQRESANFRDILVETKQQKENKRGRESGAASIQKGTRKRIQQSENIGRGRESNMVRVRAVYICKLSFANSTDYLIRSQRVRNREVRIAMTALSLFLRFRTEDRVFCYRFLCSLLPFLRLLTAFTTSMSTTSSSSFSPYYFVVVIVQTHYTYDYSSNTLS